ncbi:MAG: hypothetical protein II711_02925 [Clostridia bacterium]|nr:hypothetical protein [Clostridia bacterium]
MNVSFNGYGENIATFETAADVTVGAPVMISDNGKVSAATSAFCGVCKGLRNGYAAVQLDGYVRLPYTGTVTVGYTKLVINSGKIKTDTTNGRQILVVDVDTADGTAGIIL